MSSPSLNIRLEASQRVLKAIAETGGIKITGAMTGMPFPLPKTIPIQFEIKVME